jgi:galactokinase
MPIGGLSSSAAVTISYLRALEHVNGLTSSPLETIMLVRAVENGYLGLHSGILDQSVILSSKQDSLTVIDCSNHSISTVLGAEQQEPWQILVVYSGLSRQLTSTPFNQRVAECHEAAAELLKRVGSSPSEKPLLGDVSEEIYEQYAQMLQPHLRRRAAHFFSERARVRRGVEVWKEGNLRALGELVTASGESSIVNYESGSPALIALYEILAKTPGVYGTRFCGGGFQGCCLALIDPRKREAIADALHSQYVERYPELENEYSIHFCETADSVTVEVV